eukprot:976465-Prymnesium_polylepis.1
MELVQNADDNKYAPGCTPELHFILTAQYLLAANNEQGFAEANVWALCDVAKSTKSCKEGFIGEKGIGFKAVFTVSDYPHVASNGFEFKMKHKDVSGGELGFVVPHHAPLREWPSDVFTNVPSEQMRRTMILLPLREREASSITKKLYNELFQDFNPETVSALSALSTEIILWAGNQCSSGAWRASFRRVFPLLAVALRAESQTHRHH